MRVVRLYAPMIFLSQQLVKLDEKNSHYLLTVLRLQRGAKLELFDGNNNICKAELVEINKKAAVIKLHESSYISIESPIKIHLGQVISRGEKMDYTIQKAVELGVNKITPLFSEFCNVKLTGDRLINKIEHWQAIAVSACEQCGRNYVPQICMPLLLNDWLKARDETLKFILHPEQSKTLASYRPLKINSLAILVGSEGGFSEKEINQALTYNIEPLVLGPRILRTETAALAAISAIQSVWGDFL